MKNIHALRVSQYCGVSEQNVIVWLWTALYTTIWSAELCQLIERTSIVLTDSPMPTGDGAVRTMISVPGIVCTNYTALTIVIRRHRWQAISPIAINATIQRSVVYCAQTAKDIDTISFAYDSPDCIKIWLASVNPFLPNLCPKVTDLNVGNIWWQIVAKWLEIAFSLHRSKWINKKFIQRVNCKIPRLLLNTSPAVVLRTGYSFSSLVELLRSPVWAREHCRISSPHFLAECRKRRLNQDSFVLLCFCIVCFFWVVFSFVACVFYFSSVTYFPACTDVNGTV